MSHDVPSLEIDDLRDVLIRLGNSYVEDTRDRTSTSASRQKQPVANRIITMSAFHSEADIARQISYVRKVPRGDIGLERKRPPTEASLAILDASFCYFNARLVQYQWSSTPFQASKDPASVHSM